MNCTCTLKKSQTRSPWRVRRLFHDSFSTNLITFPSLDRKWKQNTMTFPSLESDDKILQLSQAWKVKIKFHNFSRTKELCVYNWDAMEHNLQSLFLACSEMWSGVNACPGWRARLPTLSTRVLWIIIEQGQVHVSNLSGSASFVFTKLQIYVTA